MQVGTTGIASPVQPLGLTVARAPEQPVVDAAPSLSSVPDTVDLGVADQTPAPRLGTAAQAGGAIGATLGAPLGRLLLPLAAGACGGLLAGLAMAAAAPIALPAALGIGLGAAAGLAAGVATEIKFKTGKLLAGLAGGVVGRAIGSLAHLVGWNPSNALSKLAAGFNMRRLPAKLMLPNYSGYKSLRGDAEAEQALRSTLPGDIILAHHERFFSGAAWLTKFAGAKADYTHAGIVSTRGTVVDMMEYGAQEVPTKKWLRFTHLAVLRPNYATADSSWNTAEGARNAIHEKTYDDAFNLKGDPSREYCTEYVINRVKENAPEIHIGEQNFLGYRFVTPDVLQKSPDIEKIYDSGSNFWLNHVSRVC